MRLDKLFFETPWSWSCFEARPGLKQDQDQDLLVHQDQDQDQGLAHAYSLGFDRGVESPFPGPFGEA